MENFIEKQIDASERLFKMMLEDHKERMKDAALWGEMNAGLMRKLQERDEEIAILRSRVSELERQGLGRLTEQGQGVGRFTGQGPRTMAKGE
jgi:hypothetical protein